MGSEIRAFAFTIQPFEIPETVSSSAIEILIERNGPFKSRFAKYCENISHQTFTTITFPIIELPTKHKAVLRLKLLLKDGSKIKSSKVQLNLSDVGCQQSDIKVKIYGKKDCIKVFYAAELVGIENAPVIGSNQDAKGEKSAYSAFKERFSWSFRKAQSAPPQRYLRTMSNVSKDQDLNLSATQTHRTDFLGIGNDVQQIPFSQTMPNISSTLKQERPLPPLPYNKKPRFFRFLNRTSKAIVPEYSASLLNTPSERLSSHLTTPLTSDYIHAEGLRPQGPSSQSTSISNGRLDGPNSRSGEGHSSSPAFRNLSAAPATRTALISPATVVMPEQAYNLSVPNIEAENGTPQVPVIIVSPRPVAGFTPALLAAATTTAAPTTAAATTTAAAAATTTAAPPATAATPAAVTAAAAPAAAVPILGSGIAVSSSWDEGQMAAAIALSLQAPAPFEPGEPLEDGWYQTLLPTHHQPLLARYGSLDQMSIGARAACMPIAVTTAIWSVLHPTQIPTPQTIDMLVQVGAKRWRQMLQHPTSVAFSDGFFDVDHALRLTAGVTRRCLTDCKLVIPRFPATPQRPSSARSSEPPASPASIVSPSMPLFRDVCDRMALDGCSPRGRAHGVYILVHRQHGSCLVTLPDGRVYLADSWGGRLSPGCNRAYVLLFASMRDFADFFEVQALAGWSAVEIEALRSDEGAVASITQLLQVELHSLEVKKRKIENIDVL